MRASGLGFAASGPMRLAAGLMFVGCSAGAVVLVEGQRPSVAGVSTPVAGLPVAAVRSVDLRAEATFPVTSWVVQVLGRDCPGQIEVRQWRGALSLAPGDEVVVQAQAEDPHLAAGALRLRLGTAPDQVVWGGSRITTTLTLPTGP